MLAVLAWPIDNTPERLLAAALVILGAMVLSRILQALTIRSIQDTERRYRLRKAVAFAVYVLTFVGVMAILQENLGGLTVALGVAGAGIAFALQEVISSVAGWFAISFAGFYKPGDRVQLGGIKGDVVDIGLLRTTLMEVGEWVSSDLYNGRIVRIANSFVFKEPVFNYSADFPFLWDELTVPMKYESDWRLARRVLGEVAVEVVGDYQREAAQAWRTALRSYVVQDTPVEPIVTLRPTENWIELRLRYVVDYRRRRITQDRIFTRFLEEVEAAGGSLGFASQTLQLLGGSAIDVNAHVESTPQSQG